MRRGNFFRRNQYKIAAVCVLAAVLGLTGAYMLKGRQTGEDKKQSVAQNSEKSEDRQVAQAKKDTSKTTEKKTETKTEEKDTEQTARVSAIVKPKQYETKTDQEVASAGSKAESKATGQTGGADARQPEQAEQAQQPEQAEQPAQQEQEDKKKVSETGSSKPAVPAELHFNEKNGLLWPVDGAVILDYSMDKTVYFTTLDQYKYNPAVIISGNVNDKVQAAANGKITDISVNEVTGCTVTMDIGDGYTAIYGQLKEVPYKAGAYLEAGDSLGFVSEPTKYYSLEGSNLYFALEKDGVPVDPVEFFASDIEE